MKSNDASGEILSELTLDEWAHKFWELYTIHNKKRSVAEIWLSTHQFTSRIAEGTRKSEYGEVKRALAHVFSWICAFYNQCTKVELENSAFFLKEKLWEVIAFKFPNVCGRCCSHPCKCGLDRIAIDLVPHEKLPDELKELRRLFDGSRYTLILWAEMFNSIFGSSIYRSSIESICLHLMEEVGEVAKVIRELTELMKLPEEEYKRKEVLNRRETKKEQLLEEIADSFSFLNALATKVTLVETGIREEYNYKERMKFASQYLLRALIGEYKDPDELGKIRCPTCKHNPCTCLFYLED